MFTLKSLFCIIKTISKLSLKIVSDSSGSLWRSVPKRFFVLWYIKIWDSWWCNLFSLFFAILILSTLRDFYNNFDWRVCLNVNHNHVIYIHPWHEPGLLYDLLFVFPIEWEECFRNRVVLKSSSRFSNYETVVRWVDVNMIFKIRWEETIELEWVLVIYSKWNFCYTMFVNCNFF